jgi:hypothetical protein
MYDPLIIQEVHDSFSHTFILFLLLSLFLHNTELMKSTVHFLHREASQPNDQCRRYLGLHSAQDARHA